MAGLKNSLAVLLTFLTWQLTGGAVEISVDRDIHLDFTSLEDEKIRPLALFEKSFGPLPGAIPVHVTHQCLRVGYDFTQKTVLFCPGKRVIHSGVDSPDVIRHELFHAFLCRFNSSLCTAETLKSEEATVIHEALADFFAYQIKPDDFFGENFYEDQEYIRKYRSTQCYSLAEGAHTKGNSLLTQVLRQELLLSDVARYAKNGNFTVSALLALKPSEMKNPCFQQEIAPRLEIPPENHPYSKLRRYWVKKNNPLRMRMEPNRFFLQNYPDAKIQWEKSQLFDVHEEVGEDKLNRFEFIPRDRPGTEKLTAKILSGEGTLLGTRTFYLGIRATNRASAPLRP